ncbi:MAG: Asp-tRNA(Asn)/Glu-tRNA(Gln) amidotransferase subunit GatB [Limnochordales bacterium]|nr:Asp-tRNA(Asn)/Glu-tRNA(Gln) amidotransferase subunit GatB [Limnochordales bacterium]
MALAGNVSKGVDLSRWEIVIGLEIHVELLTDSKVFCGCATDFGGEPNTRVCPVCLGLPGSLPVLNAKALEYAVKTGLALGCEIAPFSKFDRKNYFYPDLPKAYQISQYDLPLCRHGHLDIEVNGEKRRIGITRVHLEEETGKSLHAGTSIVDSPYTLLDYNRAGIPLVEIVTEPDLRSPEEARIFLEELKRVVEFAGVSDVKMEEGSLRCDANISVRPRGETRLGTKTEVKNMNSFRAVQRALEYEAARQVAVLESGGRIEQETRHWDEAAGVTRGMRSKEQAHDYRYFPEPDLVPIVLTPEQIEKWRQELPELPAARRERLMREYGLPPYDAEILTTSRKLADFFEEAARQFPDPKMVSNWVMGELLRLLKAEGKELDQVNVTPARLVGLLQLIRAGTISGATAKEVFEEMFRTGQEAAAIVERRGLQQISDEETIRQLVQKAIAANPEAVESYRKGKEKAIGALVGQVMRETRGKANPQLVNRLLLEALGKPGQ